ncbi:hypothetical protein C8C83_0664 [Flavobacterium sp. 90]|nr:hypothetical protein C8C82_0962 [Flavobacterium sp. 81]TCK52848.1 hypothetical protein C8C83_0664 [Flavobacterium sp. 90]
MTNNFKLKKNRLLTLLILVVSHYCGYSQSFLSVSGGLEKPNGKPINIELNLTSTPMECTSQTIILNIGKLNYIPSSNLISQEILVTPTTTNGETILSITGITNKTDGYSRTITIGAQFAPGTCDYTKQEITASLNFVGCNKPSINASPITVTSKTPNNAIISLSDQTWQQPYCLKKIIRYRLDITNNGNTGFNIINPQVFLELDKCAEIVGIYKYSTYESMNPVITATINTQTAVFNIPDLLLSPNTYYSYYDLYVRYPCLDGINDCTSGSKSISAYIKGKTCGSDISSNISTTTTKIITDSSCGDVTCSTGTGTVEIPTISLSSSLPCPTACNLSIYTQFNLNNHPLNFTSTNLTFIVDIPAGLNATNAYATSACNTAFTVKYINEVGEKQNTPYSGSLTRKVEFTTTCTLTRPNIYFTIMYGYDPYHTPIEDAILSFNYKLTSDETAVNGNASKTVGKCNSSMSGSTQVKKVTATNYDNNYNASGVPGEVFTYRLNITNYGTGADISTTITNILDEKLEYTGNFKYAFGNLIYESLLGNSSVTIPDLGTLNISIPKIGESGTILLKGFNFPCTTKTLYIEFNVRVKDYVTSGTIIPNVFRTNELNLSTSKINIIPFSYVKSKMFVKCSLADEWSDQGINVKNGEEVDFKMQITNAGSNPVIVSELINLKPQLNDQYEFGSNPRNSSLKINYSCDLPKINTSLTASPSVSFKYAQNPVTMDRNMLCPPQNSGNVPNWTSPCSVDTNWFNAAFPKNFTLSPGDFVEVIYKGKVSGNTGVANNSFAFKVVNSKGDCDLFSDSSNLLTITNDGIGIGCKSCALTNPNSIEIKKLFENLLKNIITRLINGETDTQINGTKPNELFLLKPYISNGGGDKIYHFVSVRNAQNKITSIRFSFSENSQNDVSFLEENGLFYDPEVGAVDSSYLKIDTSLFATPSQYFTTCRKLVSENGSTNSGTDCKNRTEVRYIDFCPDKFCVPINGEIKAIVP